MNKLCFCNLQKLFLLFLLGLYSFTKIDFLEPYSAHIDFCAMNLLTISFGVINLLSVLFIHPKQYVASFLIYVLKGFSQDS